MSDALASQDPASGEAPKSAEGQPNADESKKDGKSDASTYEAFKLPEGMTITEAHQTALTEFGQAHSLPQEAVQQIVDLGVEIAELTRQAVEEESAEGIKQLHAEWRQRLMADPELGGANIKETQANFDAFQKSKIGDADLINFLNESGLILNPHIARLISRIGVTLREKPIGFGGSEAPRGERNIPAEIYNKSNHVA